MLSPITFAPASDSASPANAVPKRPYRIERSTQWSPGSVPFIVALTLLACRGRIAHPPAGLPMPYLMCGFQESPMVFGLDEDDRQEKTKFPGMRSRRMGFRPGGCGLQSGAAPSSSWTPHKRPRGLQARRTVADRRGRRLMRDIFTLLWRQKCILSKWSKRNAA
jgi:hypothetical protein